MHGGVSLNLKFRLCFFPFSLSLRRTEESFSFNPNVSTFSSRERIQRDWNHDSLYLLMPSSDGRPPSRDDRYSESGTRGSLSSLGREREFDWGFEVGNNGAISLRLLRERRGRSLGEEALSFEGTLFWLLKLGKI